VLAIDLENALLTVAQIAVGLAGFSAILVALSGKPQQWTPVDAFRIRNILAFSFQSVFLALVPFVLASFSLPKSTVWKLSPLIIAIAIFGDVLLVLSGVYRLSRSERAVLKAPVVATVTAALFSMAAIELLAALDIIRAGTGRIFPWFDCPVGALDRIGSSVPICPTCRLAPAIVC
jgi:hypothetical protein